MARAIALCSCPRLGFMDFMGQTLISFAANGVEYKNLYGAYWSQALSGGIQEAVNKDYD